MMEKLNHTRTEMTYRIGAVARLTGVSQDTLRMWERRYAGVVPTRSEAGTRLYTQNDISRIALIKRLVDRSDAISSVANLGLPQLHERLSGTQMTASGTVLTKTVRIAILGGKLAAQLETAVSGLNNIELLGVYQDQTSLLADIAKLDVNVLVLEYATLQSEQVREIGTMLVRSGAERAVLFYRFAARATLNQLESPRISTIRGPISLEAIRLYCQAHPFTLQRPAYSTGEITVNVKSPLPKRRFDEATLAKIAATSVSMRCECPHHLVDLVSSLGAFESYSLECEVLNIEDAVLHAYLHSTVAQARSLMEDALARVIQAEEVDV